MYGMIDRNLNVWTVNFVCCCIIVQKEVRNPKMSESVANRTKIYRINQNAKPQKVPNILTARSSYIIEVSVVKRMNSLSLIFPSFAQSPNFILQDTPSLLLSSSLPITPSQLSYLAPKPNFCSYHSSYSHSSDLNRKNTHSPGIFHHILTPYSLILT